MDIDDANNAWLGTSKQYFIFDKYCVGNDVKPFLKWAGGKSPLLKELALYYPFADSEITKYAEPFIGGGAVLFDIFNRYTVKEVYISDINTALVNTYQVVRDTIDELLNRLKDYQAGYLLMICTEKVQRWSSAISMSGE